MRRTRSGGRGGTRRVPGTSPLEVRLTFAALVLLVVAVAVVGTWQVNDSRSSRGSQVLADEESSARVVAASVSSAVDEQLEFTGSLVGQFGLADLFERAERGELSRLVDALHLLRPAFARIAALSASGALLASWPPGPAPAATSPNVTQPVEQTGKSYVGEVVLQQLPPHLLVVPLATPVLRTGGRLAGILTVTLPVSQLASSTGGTTFGSGGRIVLVDQGGHVVAGAAASATRSYSSSTFVSAALGGASGSGTGGAPGIAGAALVGFSPVPALHWAVLVEEPTAAIDGSVGALTERLVLLGLLVLAICLGAGVVVLRLLRRLARAHEHAGVLLRSVGEGVATVDPDGVLRQMNPALESLTGRPSADHCGLPFGDVLPLYDARGLPIAWDDSVMGTAVRERRVVASSGYDLYVGDADGRRLPVAMTASPVLSGEQLEGAIAVVRDISHEREVDQLKSSLVSTVSHELRTPLTMIQGFSELMLVPGRFDEAQQREALGQIHSSAQRLGRLIDDLLSVARIESGRISADLEALDVGDLVAEAVSTFAAPQRERVVVEGEGLLPPVFADRDKTVQVLTNLLSNALKYSPAETPVHVHALAAGDHAEISVVDAGIGMNEGELRTVFEKFTRADHPEVRRAGGTGLGLYITKSLVELQHGQLWVESTEGLGSRFYFSLPWAPLSSVDDGLLVPEGVA